MRSQVGAQEHKGRERKKGSEEGELDEWRVMTEYRGNRLQKMEGQ